jgi:hypothetical protein
MPAEVQWNAETKDMFFKICKIGPLFFQIEPDLSHSFVNQLSCFRI